MRLVFRFCQHCSSINIHFRTTLAPSENSGVDCNCPYLIRSFNVDKERWLAKSIRVYHYKQPDAQMLIESRESGRHFPNRINSAQMRLNLLPDVELNVSFPSDTNLSMACARSVGFYDKYCDLIEYLIYIRL